MARDAPGLSDDGTVFCEGCGVVHETATALLAEGRATVVSLSSVISTRDATITQLRVGQVDKLERSKNYTKALDVLDHWHTVCMPTAREPHSEDRVKNVLARMAGKFTVDELKACADGYAKRPYVVDGKRVATGKASQRWVDAELIYRTPKHVETGIALSRLAEAPEDDPSNVDLLDWRAVQRANHRAIVRAMTAFSGRPYEDPLTGCLHTQCPRCGRGMTIYRPEGGGDSLLRCSGCPMDERAFFAALRQDEAPPQRDERLALIAEGRERLDVLGAQLELMGAAA